jgi:hypothetical protein
MLDYTIWHYQHMTDSRLKALAQEASAKIKAVTSQCDSQIQAIYQDYQEKAALIRAESSADGIEDAPALPSEPHPQSIKH